MNDGSELVLQSKACCSETAYLAFPEIWGLIKQYLEWVTVLKAVDGEGLCPQEEKPLIARGSGDPRRGESQVCCPPVWLFRRVCLESDGKCALAGPHYFSFP